MNCSTDSRSSLSYCEIEELRRLSDRRRPGYEQDVKKRLKRGASPRRMGNLFIDNLWGKIVSNYRVVLNIKKRSNLVILRFGFSLNL